MSAGGHFTTGEYRAAYGKDGQKRRLYLPVAEVE